MMEFLSKYYNYTPLLDTDCVMNNICHHMEKRVKEIKMDGETKPDEHLISLLKNNSIPLDKEKLKSLYDLYKTYKGERTNLERKRDDDQFANVIQYNNYVRNQALTISSNVSELANLAVTICYEIHPSDNKRFAWNIFGDALIDNLKSNSDKTSPVPFADPNGDIEYLGKRYALKQISIETEEDFFDIEQYYF
jgi:hypothetical protein